MNHRILLLLLVSCALESSAQQQSALPVGLERVTREDITAEALVYRQLIAIAGLGPAQQISGLQAVSLRYGLGADEAGDLLARAKALRQSYYEKVRLPDSICDMNIASREQFVNVMTDIDTDNSELEMKLLAELKSAIEPALWSILEEREEQTRMAVNAFGVRTDWGLLTEASDYRQLLSQICG